MSPLAAKQGSLEAQTLGQHIAAVRNMPCFRPGVHGVPRPSRASQAQLPTPSNKTANEVRVVKGHIAWPCGAHRCPGGLRAQHVANPCMRSCCGKIHIPPRRLQIPSVSRTTTVRRCSVGMRVAVSITASRGVTFYTRAFSFSAGGYCVARLCDA
jgi:hypothetical protein